MKKVLLLGLMAIMGLQSQAQIVSSRSSMVKTEVINEPRAGWSTFGFEFLPSRLNPDKGDSQSFTGLALTWTSAKELTSSIPLFIEFGLGAQYSFYTETESYSEKISGKTYSAESKKKWNMFSLKVPINIIYDIQIPNTKINIDPYLGLRLRGNIFGKLKEEVSGTGIKSYDEDFDVFKKDDMGEDAQHKRFQLGWQIGVKARFNNAFFVGLAYGTDFMELSKKVKISEPQISIGFVF